MFTDNSNTIHQLNKNVSTQKYYPLVIASTNIQTDMFIDNPVIISQYIYTMVVEKQTYTVDFSAKDHIIYIGCLNQQYSFYILTRNEFGYDGHIISEKKPSGFVLTLDAPSSPRDLIFINEASKTSTPQDLISIDKESKKTSPRDLRAINGASKTSTPQDLRSSDAVSKKSSSGEFRRPNPRELKIPSLLDFGSSGGELKTSSPREMKTSSPRELKTSSPREMKTSSPRELQTPSPREMKTSSLRELKTPSPREMKTSSPRELKTPSPRELKIPSPRELKTSSHRELQTSSPRELQTSSPRELQTSSPRKLKTSSPRELKTSISQELEGAVEKIRGMLGMKYVDVQFTHINNLKLMYDLINFEQKFLSPIKRMHIGVTYFDDNMMDPMEMLQKSRGKFDNNYIEFLNMMQIPFPNDIDNLYDDVYNDVEIKWFNAMEMEDELIRQHIGNLQFVIIYDNGKNPIEIDQLTIFGKMVQLVIIVKKVGGTNLRPKYSLASVRKTSEPISPMIPLNHLFEQSTLRDFLLTKAYNSLISLKYDSNLSIFHSHPAAMELKTIALKYLS